MRTYEGTDLQKSLPKMIVALVLELQTVKKLYFSNFSWVSILFPQMKNEKWKMKKRNNPEKFARKIELILINDLVFIFFAVIVNSYLWIDEYFTYRFIKEIRARRRNLPHEV